jgi:ABC-type anion transport system duplicated permease subunit
MLMTSPLRKLALTAHLTCALGWLGSVIAFLALAVAGVTNQDAQMVRAACLAMGLMVSYVIVPLAFASLLTGLVSALGTKWGLFRHYWVLIKFLLTIIAIIVLLKQLEPIRHMADAAADPTAFIAVLRGASRRPLIHAAGGVVVLLVVQVLGVYKPWGRTRYGRGKRHEQPTESQP